VILLLEPFGGLAGDMLLAALLDLDDQRLRLADLAELADSLVPGACTLRLGTVERGGFRARALEVRTPESARPPERHLSDLLALVEASSLSPSARARSARVLERLARAEARVHGVALEDVHFHEVGAVDTLVDVCGAALALERLGVERVLASTPYVGGGTVTCAHGVLPVPAPGAAELLQGIPVQRGPGGERVTPTGAALLRELVDEFEPEQGLTVLASGYGAGQRDPELGPPNLLRASLCDARPGPQRARVLQLECNLDDATGEELAFLLGELRTAGALDAWAVPVQMKKERPGAIVSALCRPAGRAALERVLFAHSPALGLRWSACERTECEREELTIQLEGRPVRVKRRLAPGASRGSPPGPLDLSPEHEDLAALARETGRPLRALEGAAIAQALARLAQGPRA
jgi:hypothetical protein